MNLLNKIIIYFITFLLCLVYSNEAHSQKKESKKLVYIDQQGIMRWEKTKKEVQGFGVNYSVPFAHAYRSAKRMGIDIKKAIDNDIYHFKRLGFDLYRLHVWDTQISDTLGNILKNEHLDTFDYLISKLKKQHINYVITPIAFWGNGWPEPDTKSPGFSYKYGKKNALVNEDAIKAQQNYLFQFLNHKNPYTGLLYKEDPNVIAFEVSNEPHHTGESKKVTEFVKKMVKAMKKTGTKKPIFYNMSHAVHFTDAYFKGGAQGGTFQWYPTGLLYGKELEGNLLPNVDQYKIPFETTFKKHKGAKLVYEFDAADVGKSYIYPAMARSFRTAGIQIATYFAYDPTYIADINTEYNSHFMNLAYTPSKALSLKICAEIFHTMPLYKSYGAYPNNKNFDNVNISYENDLALYNNNQKYFYTNHTYQSPKNQSTLKEIAGFGSSPIIKYDGKGGYFLDKIDNGVWRLEVMPDAIWVDNPFGRNSYEKKVAVIHWQENSMNLNLKDLGNSFTINAINNNNTFKPSINGTNFRIYPGVYIISRKGVEKKWARNDVFKGYLLKSYYAPNTNVDKTYLKHKPQKEFLEGSPLNISAQIISNRKIKHVELVGNHSKQSYFKVAMKKTEAYQYKATLDTIYSKKGFLNYNIIITFANGEQHTYPANKKGHLYDWNFYDRKPYTVQIISSDKPIHLFEAKDDAKDLILEWRKDIQGNPIVKHKLIPTNKYEEAEFQISLKELFTQDIENLNATPIHDYSFKHFIKDRINERVVGTTEKRELVVYGKSLLKTPIKIQVALVLKNGSSFGKVIELTPKREKHKIQLSNLNPVKTVTLPRPYPSFLPYFFNHKNTESFNIKDVESIQMSIGSGIPVKELNKKIKIAITSISLE